MHALADHFGRKVVLVGPNDKEIVVEPGPELGLKATTNAAAASSGFIEPAVGYVERYADPVAALCSGSINDFAENGFVR
jgi:hypothetical protein